MTREEARSLKERLIDKATDQGFYDELQKLAEDEPKYWNKEMLKQLGRDAAAVGAGTGLGYGALTLADLGIQAVGRKYRFEPTEAQRKIMRRVIGPALGAGGALATQRLHAEMKRRMAEAKKRGEEKE